MSSSSTSASENVCLESEWVISLQSFFCPSNSGYCHESTAWKLLLLCNLQELVFFRGEVLSSTSASLSSATGGTSRGSFWGNLNIPNGSAVDRFHVSLHQNKTSYFQRKKLRENLKIHLNVLRRSPVPENRKFWLSLGIWIEMLSPVLLEPSKGSPERKSAKLDLLLLEFPTDGDCWTVLLLRFVPKSPSRQSFKDCWKTNLPAKCTRRFWWTFFRKRWGWGVCLCVNMWRTKKASYWKNATSATRYTCKQE